MIGDAALPSPNSLVIIVGRTPAQLAHTPDSVQVTSIATTVPGWPVPRTEANPQGLTYIPANPGGGASAIDLILSVVALAILAPVLIFIATATRLSAARREERFAAMRLAGATRKQVSLLAATESTVAGILGVAVGFGIFFLLRIPVAGIPFIGKPFFPGDLSLSLLDVLVVAIGVPLSAAVAARLALRRVHISPLGVARRATPKPPRAWRMVPLLAGLAELGFWAVHGHPASITGQIQAFVSSFALIIVGLFIAGPWLTMAAARVMARWTSRPGTLIAARRLADDPRAAFRAVSGLVLALFITTVAVVAITTQNAKDPTRFGSVAESNVLTDQVSASNQVAQNSGPGSNGGTAGPGPAAPAAPLTAQLSGIPGVKGVLVVRADPGLTIPAKFHDLGVNRAPPVRSRPAWSRARSSRPFPPLAAARPGRQRRRSRRMGSTALCSARTSPRSPGRPRTSRPRGWTPSAWTPSTWRRTAARRRSSRQGRCLRTHTPTPGSPRRPPSATSSRRTTPRTATTSSSRTW